MKLKQAFLQICKALLFLQAVFGELLVVRTGFFRNLRMSFVMFRTVEIAALGFSKFFAI